MHCASDRLTLMASPPRALVRLVSLATICSMAVCGVAIVPGCTTHYVVQNTKPPLVEKLKLNSDAAASDRTMQVLRQYDLMADLQAIIDREPSAEKLYAVAELSYRAGQRVGATDETAALEYYGMAVAYAYLYLFDERFSTLR